MPSMSPSPAKRPSMTERSSSQASLSSSSKQNAGHKPHRPHVAKSHSRNLSHGKNLSKLNRTHSAANVTETKTHQRKKSGPTIPQRSPTSPGLPKRNTSHVALLKNLSHRNLRKNHSETLLGRNTSHTGLKKLGLAPAPRPKEESKTGFFQLGDQSSGEEEEGEWEDTNTQSPEFTRNNSKASTPARIATPSNDQAARKLPESGNEQRQRTSSPPAPIFRSTNRSLPDIRQDSGGTPTQDPALLNHNGRSSRAPPAMSTIAAHAAPNLLRSESSKSFTHINHADIESTNAQSASITEASASAENGISRFLNQTPKSGAHSLIDNGSDEDSATFMSNYKPQPSESPEKPRNMNKSTFASMPSRTQQKLELQRREAMRQGPATPPSASLGMAVGSSLSLHSRSGSRGRNRSLADDAKAQKINYETGVKQLLVVRRFRNPVLESLHRLKEKQILPADTGAITTGAGTGKGRPPSRRGLGTVTAGGNAAPGESRNQDSKKPSPITSRSNSRGAGGKVHFSRQGSHDDIGVTPSQVSPDGGDFDNGMSPEEALMRRMWNSQVYDTGEAMMAR